MGTGDFDCAVSGLKAMQFSDGMIKNVFRGQDPRKALPMRGPGGYGWVANIDRYSSPSVTDGYLPPEIVHALAALQGCGDPYDCGMVYYPLAGNAISDYVKVMSTYAKSVV